MEQQICFKKLSDRATIPTRGTPDSAGMDVYSAERIAVPPNSRLLVKTDLAVAFPKGHYLRVAPRSSVSMKGIDIAAGVVDYDYRGNIGVILTNHNNTWFNIEVKDRIAQFILEKISNYPIVEVTELPEASVKHEGFGSTGK